MEQSRRTAAAVCACITERDYTTGLIALAILAEQIRQRTGELGDRVHPLLQSARVTADGLLNYAAVRAELPLIDVKADTLSPHMDVLRALPFEVSAGATVNGNSTEPVARPRHGDILFDIVRVREWKTPADRTASNVSWLVRGGQWAYWNMNETGRILLCRIAAASLSHTDPASLVLTMKLGRALGFGAVYPANNGSLDLSVADALEAVGELPDPANSDRRCASGLFRRFGNALQSLREHGVMNDLACPANFNLMKSDNDVWPPEDWLEARFRFGPASIPVGMFEPETLAGPDVLRF